MLVHFIAEMAEGNSTCKHAGGHQQGDNSYQGPVQRCIGAFISQRFPHVRF